MTTPSGARGVRWVALALLAFCPTFTWLLLTSPRLIGMTFLLGGGARMIIWPELHRSLSAFLVANLLAAAAFGLGRWALSRAPEPGRLRDPLRILLPLACLPLALDAVFLRRWLPPFVAANILFGLPCLAVAIVLARAAGRDRPAPPPRSQAVLIIAATLFVSIAFMLIGTHFTRAAGAHQGDEGHYLVQAESLYYDGDLDIRNQAATQVPAGESPEVYRGHFHISPASKGQHWYSLHPFGLSVLLAPAEPLGVAARHAVLGLISGVGCGLVLLLGLRLGASAGGLVLVTGLFWFSVCYGVYSCRALPEVLGATLLLGLVAAVFLQREWPRLSVVIGVLCFCALPWAHTRFIPLAGVAAAFYLYGGLAGPPLGRAGWIRLGLFCLGGAAGWLAYYGVYRSMFKTGASYAIGDLLFSCPSGVWHVLVSNLSPLYTMPMFAWLLAALWWGLFRDRDNRLANLVVLALLATVLATSCTTYLFFGGTCLPGRMLLVTLPLLILPAARCWDRAAPLARWWLVFLGLLSCAEFLLLLLKLRDVGLNFTYPPRALVKVLPLLVGLIGPLRGAEYESLHLFGATLHVGTALLLFIPRPQVARQAGVLAVIVAAALYSHVGKGPMPTPCVVPTLRGDVDLRKACVQEWQPDAAARVPARGGACKPVVRLSFDGTPSDAVHPSRLVESRGVAPGPDRHGNLAGAGYFDGTNSLVKVPGVHLANSSFSAAMWIRRAEPTRLREVVLSQGQPRRSQGLHVGFYPDRPFVFAFWDNDLDASQAGPLDQAWHLWTVVKDTDKRFRAIYRDHWLKAISRLDEDYSGSGPLVVGSDAWGESSYFHGWLDDVTVYRGALSADAVLRMYGSTNPEP